MTYAPIRKADWRLSIADVDATLDLMPMVESIDYVDNAHGEADEVSVTLDDDGRFISGRWLPDKADRLGLRIGFEGASKIDCGAFEIDDLDFERQPNKLKLRALSAPMSKSLRTKRTTQFDQTTLARIAADVAARHDLALIGEIADIPIRRRTQHDVTDLAFIKDIAEEYGYVVKVDADRLIFHELQALDALAEVLTIGVAELGPQARLKRKTVATYKDAVCEFTDPTTGETRTARATAQGVDSGDTLRRHIEAESLADAERKAQAALYRANRAAQTSGSLPIEGRPEIAAGATILIPDWGVLSGRYKIAKAVHRWRAGGAWTASIDVEGLS